MMRFDGIPLECFENILKIFTEMTEVGSEGR